MFVYSEIPKTMKGLSYMRFLSLSGGVKLRMEYFGGIVFDTDAGTMVDVDREAFVMLSAIYDKGVINQQDLPEYLSARKINIKSIERIEQVIGKLLELGILVEGNGSVNEILDEGLDNTKAAKPSWPMGPHLSAPETVHWAVTFKCGEKCPDCYAARHSGRFSTELDTQSALEVVDKIAKWGVFQLAIGGGEPLLRQDLIEIAARARQKGLVVHVTTGCYEPDMQTLNGLSENIKYMQIGIKHEQLVAQPEVEFTKLTRLVSLIGSMGINTGANLVLSKTTLHSLRKIVDKLVLSGFKRITFLRYKPPADITRWKAENPSTESMLKAETLLQKLKYDYPKFEFRLDCGLSFLQRKVSPDKALLSGVRGCVASNRIVSIAADGAVYPCSQLVYPQFYSGNIHKDEVEQFWIKSKGLKTHRFYREKSEFKRSVCGICKARNHCGGCRVFADNVTIGADKGCHDPVLMSPGELDKNGRYADLMLFCMNNFGISVEEYMERYGVGIKKIENWIDEDDENSYPKWLKGLDEYI